MDTQLIALAVASSVCFGLALPLSQAGLRHVSPIRGATISLPSTALLFLLLAPFVMPQAGWHWPSAGIFALIGVLYPLGVTTLIFGSNLRLGPEFTAALGNLAPLFAVVFAWFLLDDLPRVEQFVAIAVIGLGLTMLFVGPNSRLTAPAWCLLLPLAAALLRGLAQPAVKIGLAEWPSPFAATLIAYLVSASLLYAMLWARHGSRGLLPTAAPRRAKAWFLAVGVVNGMAQILLFMALARGSVAVVAPIVASSPLVTLAVSRMLPGRRPMSTLAVVGAAVSVVGIAMLLAF